MSDAPAVLRETEGAVAVLTLNRPERGNTLDGAVLAALDREVGLVAADSAMRGVVITGAGRDFCLGGDLAEFDEALHAGPVGATAYCQERTSALARVVTALTALRMPVVAAVNGQAAGAGFSLALACDLRIAEPRTRLHFAYATLGASTDGGMTWFLPRVVGPARALELLLEQPVIRAKQAEQERLVSCVVPVTDLVSRAVRTAAALGSASRHSVVAAKQLVQAAGNAGLSEHLELEHALFSRGLLSEDMKIGLQARREGRAPIFGSSD